MADKSNQLILTALSRAAAAPDGMPLHGTKTTSGLFPTNAVGKQAAQRCQEEGYLCPVSLEDGAENPADGGTITLVKKKTAKVALCTITDKGLTYLLSQVSPRQVLEDFVRALEARQQQTNELLNVAQQMRQSIDAMKVNVDKVLQQTYQTEGTTERGASGSLKALFAGFLSDSPSPCSTPGVATADGKLFDAVLRELAKWEQSGASEDCPLPHLYRQVGAASIGQFHDALRQLHDREKIYLHPWTGPLYDIPEPPYALLIGHEIAYYASTRK